VTLDLGRLSAEIRAMGDHLVASRGLLDARIQNARDLLASADRDALAAAAEAKRGAVVPVEDLTTRVGAMSLPDGYQVLATDGSDIEPDRHGPALCYVLNLGWAIIQYGAHPHAELGSAPELYYRPEDLYVRDGSRQAPIQGSRLGAKRAVAEMQRLAALCAAGSPGPESPAPIPERVALSDGLLLLGNYWEGPEGFVRDYFVGQFKAALDALRTLDVPVAAYISRPRGADVIGLLRLDPRHQQACDWCAGKGTNRADCALEGLADRLLFPDLAPGERSPLFESRALAQHYPPELLPRFFYLNVGREIARVEMPVWAAERPELVARVQAVVVDQCRRGQGYPVALARAHEQAVIGGAERQRFDELVARVLVARGLPDHPSEKQASKLARAVLGMRTLGDTPKPPPGERPWTPGEEGTGARALRVGEIVEASSCELVAQSPRLHEAPAFGSLVRVPVTGDDQLPPGLGGAGGASRSGPTELYGVVAETRTASLEAGGRPIARGHEDVLDAAIYRENPDLEHVLRTEFKALLVGFRVSGLSPRVGGDRGGAASPAGLGGIEGGPIFQHLPPLPPPLHYSVYACTPAEVMAFTERLDFLRTLLAAPPGLADELAAATIRAAATARGGASGDAFLLRVGRELAVLLRDDYDRLTAVLRRLRPTEARG
jgi:hypothetical protein